MASHDLSMPFGTDQAEKMRLSISRAHACLAKRLDTPRQFLYYSLDQLPSIMKGLFASFFASYPLVLGFGFILAATPRASAVQCNDLDVPYSWETQIIGESQVEAVQSVPSVGVSKTRSGKIEIKFQHKQPALLCEPPPPLPSTKLKVTGESFYYYICSALILCNDLPWHRSSISVGVNSVNVVDSYKDPSRLNSNTYISLVDKFPPLDPNPKTFLFDFAGVIGLTEQIDYELSSGVSGISPFGVDELRTKTIINLSLTTDPAGFVTYKVQQVPAPPAILALGIFVRHVRSLKRLYKRQAYKRQS